MLDNRWTRNNSSESFVPASMASFASSIEDIQHI